MCDICFVLFIFLIKCPNRLYQGKYNLINNIPSLTASDTSNMMLGNSSVTIHMDETLSQRHVSLLNNF